MADEMDFTPAREFGDITSNHDAEVPWTSLEGKMAVIYIDGNKFSRQIQKSAIDSDTYRSIDTHLRDRRANLMRSFISRMKEDDRRYWRVGRTASDSNTSHDALRFETLMWGGDELVWVVPAWCGLETIRFFSITLSPGRFQ